jgi:hypothetical protein
MQIPIEIIRRVGRDLFQNLQIKLMVLKSFALYFIRRKGNTVEQKDGCASNQQLQF